MTSHVQSKQAVDEVIEIQTTNERMAKQVSKDMKGQQSINEQDKQLKSLDKGKSPALRGLFKAFFCKH